MAEGRVTQVMGKGDGLHEVLVEGKRPSNGPRDLRYLESVRQPCPVVVSRGRKEDLRLGLEPPERLAVGYPVLSCWNAVRISHSGSSLTLPRVATLFCA